MINLDVINRQFTGLEKNMLIFSCNSIRTYIEILRKFRFKMAWILPVIEKEQNGRKTSAVHTFCNKSMIQTIIMS